MNFLKQMCTDLNTDPGYVKLVGRYAARYYRHFQIPKRAGGKRTICQPSAVLKAFQYWLTQNLVAYLPVSEYATAYRLGCSIKRNAGFHLGAKHVLHLDVKDYFPSIKSSMLLDRISVDGKKIPGGDRLDDEDFQLISWICFLEDQLTIGSVCAPAISNAVMYPLDCEVAAQVRALKLTYTRYADDMVFSGPDFIDNKFVPQVQALLSTHGLQLNDRKTRFMGGADKQLVTGITLNSGRLSIGRERKDGIRKMLYVWLKTGQGTPARIMGHLQFLRDVEPETFNSLIQKYNFLFKTNIMARFKDDSAPTAAREAAATKSVPS